MSAKEMFKELGYECYDDRERKGLPVSISYVVPNHYELGGHSPYVNFILPDKRWETNIVHLKKDVRLMKAINKQCEELGWYE